LLVKAAVLSSADQTKGLDAIFRSVASFPYGSWLLALLACGLFCYGLYCLVEVRYRDLTPGQCSPLRGTGLSLCCVQVGYGQIKSADRVDDVEKPTGSMT
jgi:hypothetical protein